MKDRILAVLDEIHKSLYENALKNREERTFVAKTIEELKDNAKDKSGFTKAMWCGERECEEKIKETAGLTSRCIPFEQEEIDTKCVWCSKRQKKWFIRVKYIKIFYYCCYITYYWYGELYSK